MIPLVFALSAQKPNLCPTSLVFARRARKNQG